MPRQMITPHFSIDEFDCYDGTPYPREWIAMRLRPLCIALEVVRDHAGRPITITPRGGYRTETLNRKIGGAKLSQHVEGRASDFIIAGMTAAQVHDLVLDLYRSGALVIGGLGAYTGFTHVDVRPSVRLVRWGGSRVES